MSVDTIFPKLFELLPDADHLLSLQPEELAGPLLISLDGSDLIEPSDIISFGLIQKYPDKHDADILLALMASWQWLQREGFVAPRPTNLSEGTTVGGGVTYYFVTRRGKAIETTEALEVYRKGNLLPNS